jgi:predicted nuclease of predicted toxin-antitoxin system
MKFLIDAQLPYGLSLFINKKGFNTIHTDDLPDRERTKDIQICKVADLQDRIVITKDKDFITSFILDNTPAKLMVVSTGNIQNQQLFTLFSENCDKIIRLFQVCNLVEMNNEILIGR